MPKLAGPVLITGCSSGIGRAVARHLLRQGHHVYASARRPDAVADLATAGASVVSIDVTDDESMAKAVAEIEAEHGQVGALVNNAGFAEYGPVETVPIQRAREQFETNFFGLTRMCQLVLPGMRRGSSGHIINISSVGGRMGFPGGGVYNASKFAVEGLSDALRFEAAPFGVFVTVVEPNLIRDTNFDEHVGASLDRNTPELGPYGELRKAIGDQMGRCFTSAKMSSPPSAVADTVDRALRARKPRGHYVVSPSGRFLVNTRRIVSDRVWDDVMRRQFGLTKTGAYNGKWAANA
ncbi:MAG TPA: SDR family NAD(P)-dependent oxidoreductase [Pseudonocardiaceae bacterium]